MQATSLSDNTDSTRDRPAVEELQLAFVNAGRRLRAAYRTDPAAVGVLHTLACHGPMRVSALAEALVLDISTMSRHVSSVEADGLVTREPDHSDRRATQITMTPAGAEFLAAALEERATTLSAATRDWPEGDLTTLITLINRLADDLGALANSKESS